MLNINMNASACIQEPITHDCFILEELKEVQLERVVEDKKSPSVSKQFISFSLVELVELSEHNFTFFQSRPRNVENVKRPETKVSE